MRFFAALRMTAGGATRDGVCRNEQGPQYNAAGDFPFARRINMRGIFVRRMLVRCTVAGLAVLILFLGSALLRISVAARGDARGNGSGAAALAEPQSAQCVATVPKAWGQYRGGSAQSGLSFEDANGTLRFITNLPCGSVPTVALEIRRGGN
jgi:hypothetical protein